MHYAKATSKTRQDIPVHMSTFLQFCGHLGVSLPITTVHTKLE